MPAGVEAAMIEASIHLGAAGDQQNARPRALGAVFLQLEGGGVHLAEGEHATGDADGQRGHAES